MLIEKEVLESELALYLAEEQGHEDAVSIHRARGAVIAIRRLLKACEGEEVDPPIGSLIVVAGG